MSAELIKYVALQLLVLSGSLNEELVKTGDAGLPISFATAVVPTNLADLIREAQTRVSSVRLTTLTAPVPPPAQTVSVPSAPLAPPAHPVAGPAVVKAPATAGAAPAAPTLTRRRRDVDGVISESADVVGHVSESVTDSPLALIPGVGRLANAVEQVSQYVEDATKPETTALGELLLPC